MTIGNNLELEAEMPEILSNPKLKSIGTDICSTSTPVRELIPANRQYTPSDSLELDESRHASSENRIRNLIGNFNLDSDPALPRSNAAIDLFTAMLCFAAVHLTYLGNLDFSSQRAIALFGSLVLLIASLFIGGLYNTKRLQSLNTELTKLIACWMCAFAAIGLFAFLTKTAAEVSRVWITSSMAFVLVSLTGVRILDCLWSMTGNNAKTRSVVICGHSASIKPVMHNLYRAANSKVRVARIFEFSPDASANSDSLNALQTSARQIVKFIEKQRQNDDAIEQVWVAVSADQSKTVKELSKSLINSTVDVCVIPDLYTDRLLNGEVNRFGGVKIVNVSEISLNPTADQFKRVFDVFLASIALIALIIPMAVIAALIKMETSGPALFRQKRYGVDGKEIEVFKFRSMLVHKDEQVMQATKNDSRVTRIGKVLRSTSLDELPQLLNVLSGTMSLVGPRPHAVSHNEMWRKQIQGYMLRHKVRPGITGWAQVNGWRGETDTAFKMQQRVKFDLDYIRNWSPWLDIKILFFTVVRGFHDENAY